MLEPAVCANLYPGSFMLQIGTGTMCVCSFGMAPSTLNVVKTVMATTPAGNASDMAPMVNIPPFGMCTTQSNPAVAAATTAAGGVPTPAACVPVIPAPWIPGPVTSMIMNVPSINMLSTLMCAYGGVIKPTAPSQTVVSVQS